MEQVKSDRIELLEYLRSIGRQSFELDDRMKLTLIEADDQQKHLDETDHESMNMVCQSTLMQEKTFAGTEDSTILFCPNLSYCRRRRFSSVIFGNPG